MYNREQLAAKAILKTNLNHHLNIINVGNSIASGYSFKMPPAPLLMDSSLPEILKACGGVDAHYHNFSRCQNNNDEHLFEWLISNISEDEITKLNIRDYDPKSATAMFSIPFPGVAQDLFKNRPFEKTGLFDLVFDRSLVSRSIIIINSCTGSFLDNITRKGRFKNKFLYGFKRDLRNLSAFLTVAQTMNRKADTDTQIYVCGLPSYPFIRPIMWALNRKIRKLTEEFACATYVKSVPAKFFCKFNGEHYIDVHHDQSGYKKLESSILESIANNYIQKHDLISFDRFLYHHNDEVEKGELWPDDFKKEFKEYMTSDTVRKYLRNRLPYDFWQAYEKGLL